MVLSQDISIGIKKPDGRNPRLGLILGSGLGDYTATLDDQIVVETSTIDGYPDSSVPGHEGKLVFGKIGMPDGTKKDILVFQGRIHFYETRDLSKTLIPIVVAHKLGIRRLIITNAAGGMNPLFSAGDLMLIQDFINTTSENPLFGLTANYRKINDFDHIILSNFLIDRARSIANDLGIALRVGIYCWVKGPSYETAAEIQMLRRMGGDAVGMSTVPEIIAAKRLGIDCVAISCITNMSTGLSAVPLSHHEVTATAHSVQENFTRLISALAREMA
jgi:purine-nucleoside phosphorylase